MSAIDLLANRLRILVDRVVVTRLGYEGKARLAQIAPREDTTMNDFEHFEPQGFTSHPLPGSEGIALNPGGNSGRGFLISVRHRKYRLVVEEGEVAIYHHTGDRVHLKNNGEIHVKAATKVRLETPLVECTQNLHVLGNVQIDGTAQIANAVTMQTTAVVVGNVTMQAGVSIAGNTTSTGSISTTGSIVAGGVSLDAHVHINVQHGSDSSGGPV